tara:strand:+ start:945 stop:1952 length:1008 start_codon:yes stop_codon:yes gene_type:complete
MHVGSVTLAEEYMKYDKKVDLLLCSDMLNLPVFHSICSRKIKNIPVAMYFHENQISYPWSPDDQDTRLERDFHYYFINYTSALVSSCNFFNSQYHLDSFIKGLRKYLKKMPDFNDYSSIDLISSKSSVLYLGTDLLCFNRHKQEYSNKSPVILWNHRWEYDKNPEDFFSVLGRLKRDGLDFKVVVLGRKYSRYPEVFDKAREELSDSIIHFGYCDEYSDYCKYLWMSDFLPVTSIQEYFGISVIEAVFCNTIPILPNRLSYPELYNIEEFPDLFYKDRDDLYRNLKRKINDFYKSGRPKINLSEYILHYDWKYMASEYDSLFKGIELPSDTTINI